MDRSPAAASIAFGQVRHTRLRPVRHAFCYPAFFLRLPLSRLDASVANLRWLSHNRWNVFSFHDADHCAGAAGVAPRDWIDRTLREAGIVDADGEVWLHAFPRMFGYVFNPVSFWFCHRSDGALRAILCAVCNTFGERHAYLLENADGAPLANGCMLTARKVFHVSPFCKVEGWYRFRFLQSGARSQARIDYFDSGAGDGPRLLTSIRGAHVPLDDGALLRALLRYPLFTFGVMARIHYQALRLWLKRLPFYSKPDALPMKVTR